MNSLQAQVYNGGGIPDGVNAAAGITGVASGDPRSVVINIVATALNFAALAAFVMVIIAGFYLVLSNGNDDNKEKAKKTIYYTLIGLVVLLFSRAIVTIFTEWLPSQV
jgi:hypothetical protein